MMRENAVKPDNAAELKSIRAVLHAPQSSPLPSTPPKNGREPPLNPWPRTDATLAVNTIPMSTAGKVIRALLLIALTIAVVAQGTAQDNQNTLKLSDAQKATLRALQGDSAAKTATILGKLPQIAKVFNANLLSDTPDAELDQKLSQQMAESFAEVIRLRLGRIRATAKALTPEQRLALGLELKKSDGPYLFDDLVREVLGDPAK
jgi:hypothetical protein